MSVDVYRVVVVGAGMAGLTTANALLASGHFSPGEICVLEAQPRIGGRIYTRPFSDELPVQMDVGAAWIHGMEGNPIAALAQVFGIELKEISARNPWLHPGFLIYDSSRQLTDDEVKETWKWGDLLLRKLQELALSGKGEGKALGAMVEQLLVKDAELREIIESNDNARERLLLSLHLVETWMGSTSNEMQIDAFSEIDLMGDDPGAHCLVPTGMESFIQHLSAPVQSMIRTNTSVSSINYDDTTGVVIECTNGSKVRADRVVVTCSLGFLKSGKLHFHPELPLSKADVIARSQMGQCMKVKVQFPEAFWPKNASFITQINVSEEMEAHRIYFPVIFSYYAVKGVPIVEGDCIGDKALVTLSDDEIAHALFLQLQDMFGLDIPEPVDHLVTRWDKYEWARGAYSSVTMDSTYQDPDLLRQSVAMRLFFAGEATNYEYQGALQAAYLSGQQAAKEIIAEVNRP